MTSTQSFRILIAVTAVFLTFPSLGSAQQSAFQTGNGQTSLYLQGATAATLNFGDSKASFGRYLRFSNRQLVLGYEVFAKASSGVTTLLSSKIKVPEGGGSFVIGWHQKVDLNSPPPASGSTTDQWALLDLGYSRSAFYVSNAAVNPEDAKRYFNRFRFIGVYNRVQGRFAFGLAMGAERRNNLDNLRQITFQTTLLPAPTDGSTSIVKTQSGFLGIYDEYVAAPVYTDIVYLVPKLAAPGFAKTSIAIDGFTRSNIADTNRFADGGLGIFITEKNAPTKVYGGITGSWNGGKAKVAVVASYVF
jgi:hypothetical protein